MRIGHWHVLTARLAWNLVALTAILTSLPWWWAWSRERAEADRQREFAVARHVPVRRIVLVYANESTAMIELKQQEEQP